MLGGGKGRTAHMCGAGVLTVGQVVVRHNLLCLVGDGTAVNLCVDAQQHPNNQCRVSRRGTLPDSGEGGADRRPAQWGGSRPKRQAGCSSRQKTDPVDVLCTCPGCEHAEDPGSTADVQYDLMWAVSARNTHWRQRGQLLRATTRLPSERGQGRAGTRGGRHAA